MPDRSDIFTPTPDDQIGRLALIEAIRANTDALQRVGRQVESQERKFDDVNKTLGEMKTDIALLKNNALKDQVERNRADIDSLEKEVADLKSDRDQRRGAMSLFDWFLRNWPAVIGFALLIVFIAKQQGML